MLKYNYKIEYEDDEFDCPIISFDMKYHDCSFHWHMYDLHYDTIEIWKNIRECIDNKNQSQPIGGNGGNSYWTCECDNGVFVLNYVIDAYNDSSFSFIIPCEEMKGCIDVIIDVLNYASQNIIYHKLSS